MKTIRYRRRVRLLVNAVTVLRIAGSLALLAVVPLSAPYFAVYAVCAMSDVLDGWIARRAKVASAFGASLDSAADAIFAFALIASLLSVVRLSTALWLWMAAIVLIKISSLVIGYARFCSYAALHTYANKFAGLAVFALPVLIAFFDPVVAAAFSCAAATFAALEELVLTASAPVLDRDARGLLGGWIERRH